MSKRNAYFETLEQSRLKTLDNIQGKTNAVDETIENFEKKVFPVENETPKKTEKITLEGFSLEFKPKETKSVHKNFLFSKALSDKIAGLAKKTGASENEIVNEILKKALEL